MPSNQPFQAFNLARSFEEGSVGRESQRVINLYGEQRLDHTIWDAGLIAYEFLKNNVEDAVSADGYRRWVGSAKNFLAEDFYPHFLEMISSGRVDLKNGSIGDFQAAWHEYDWVEQLNIFLQMLDQTRIKAPLPENSDDFEYFDAYVAAALLWRIDDAVISVFCDGSGLSGAIVDIIELRNRLRPATQSKITLDVAIRAARREIGKAGASAKLAKDPKQNEKSLVRDCWQKWQSDRTRYKSTAAFARDMLQKYENLESQQVIERWCRDWTKGSLPAE